MLKESVSNKQNKNSLTLKNCRVLTKLGGRILKRTLSMTGSYATGEDRWGIVRLQEVPRAQPDTWYSSRDKNWTKLDSKAKLLQIKLQEARVPKSRLEIPRLGKLEGAEGKRVFVNNGGWQVDGKEIGWR